MSLLFVCWIDCSSSAASNNTFGRCLVYREDSAVLVPHSWCISPGYSWSGLSVSDVFIYLTFYSNVWFRTLVTVCSETSVLEMVQSLKYVKTPGGILADPEGLWTFCLFSLLGQILTCLLWKEIFFIIILLFYLLLTSWPYWPLSVDKSSCFSWKCFVSFPGLWVTLWTKFKLNFFFNFLRFVQIKCKWKKKHFWAEDKNTVSGQDRRKESGVWQHVCHSSCRHFVCPLNI